MKYNADQVEQLARDIIRHKELYYAGNPEISDTAYDALEAVKEGGTAASRARRRRWSADSRCDRSKGGARNADALPPEDL